MLAGGALAFAVFRRWFLLGLHGLRRGLVRLRRGLVLRLADVVPGVCRLRVLDALAAGPGRRQRADLARVLGLRGKALLDGWAAVVAAPRPDRGLAERLVVGGRLRRHHVCLHRRDGRGVLPGRCRGVGLCRPEVLDALVADAAGEQRSGAHGHGLEGETAAEPRCTAARAAAEEGAERGRERNRGERFDRAALGPLAAGDPGAFLALAEVGAEGAALLALEPPVELARDRELGLVAGDSLLELLAQGATCPEDQRFDGAHREAEDLGDLLIGAPLELAHHERGPLVEGEMRSEERRVGKECRSRWSPY